MHLKILSWCNGSLEGVWAFFIGAWTDVGVIFA